MAFRGGTCDVVTTLTQRRVRPRETSGRIASHTIQFDPQQEEAPRGSREPSPGGHAGKAPQPCGVANGDGGELELVCGPGMNTAGRHHTVRFQDLPSESV